MFRPRASSPWSVELLSAIALAGGDALPDVDDGALVDARALVAADELLEPVAVELAGVRLDLGSARR